MRYLVVGAAAVAVVGAVLFWWLVLIPGPTDFAGGDAVALADYHGASPTGVPAEMAQASLVARGEYLTRAADCTACHTAKGGTPYAGGLALNLPFGTIYSPNITPDKKTGIGEWTDKQFIDAVRRGIDDEGKPLYPAMSYTSYAYMTDADVLAIKAYLFSLAPVHQENRGNNFSFPVQSALDHGRMGRVLRAERAVPAEAGTEPRMESRRLRCRGAGALR